MKKVTMVIPDGANVPFPFDEGDAEILAQLKRNIPIEFRINTGFNERSVPQNNMYRAWCRTCAENTDDPFWDTPEKVHNQVRYALKFFDTSCQIPLPGGAVYMPLRSLSFRATEHKEACKYVDLACPIIAEKMGISEQELRDESRPGYWPVEQQR